MLCLINILEKVPYLFFSGNFEYKIGVIRLNRLIKEKLEFDEIIEQCKKGEQAAQGVLFNTFYKQLYHLCMRILANHHDTEDVLIMSFTRIFRNIANFEYRGFPSLNKWMKTIVVNESIRLVTARNQLHYTEDMTVYEISSSPEPELDHVDLEKVYSIIETMPVGYRIVFNLFAVEGYSHKEISYMLKISENTSKSQLRKARMHIIEKMKKIQSYGFTKY
jgi:RNA polymerase sigma-70 factor, ECF subfamily